MPTIEYLDRVGLEHFWEKICQQDRDLLDKITANSNKIAILEEQIGNPLVRYNTVEGWNSQPNLRSETGVIYIYLDRAINDSNQIVPGFKVGNGAFLIDLQFVDSLYVLHIQDKNIHITEEERKRWNRKIDVDVDQANENLLFNNEVTING